MRILKRYSSLMTLSRDTVSIKVEKIRMIPEALVSWITRSLIAQPLAIILIQISSNAWTQMMIVLTNLNLGV